MSQLTLFDAAIFPKQKKQPDALKGHSVSKEWGTFKDSLRAPVHNWFTYPAGFSYRAVEHSLRQATLQVGCSTVYDPFMGSGTTNIVAKAQGFHSIGVEAHPFVHRITQSKMNWNVPLSSLNNAVSAIEKDILLYAKKKLNESKRLEILQSSFPELILKCFLPETLFELKLIRDAIEQHYDDTTVGEILRTALVCVLRDVSIAATGWPYIAPKKIKVTSLSKNGWGTFKKRLFQMCQDLHDIRISASSIPTIHHILLGDSRNTTQSIDDESVDHVFTSPPYLNNFDYADRTRLELYFMGEAKNWSDISEQIRTKLITSATTQISRNDKKYTFRDEFISACPKEYTFLSDVVEKLSVLRCQKGGKKSYDLLAIGYFNDLYCVLRDVFRVLREGSKALFILGDSAPYGVHIPTDELIGRIGVAVGFQRYKIQILRTRGQKWANNPQRHDVVLRESIVTLTK